MKHFILTQTTVTTFERFVKAVLKNLPYIDILTKLLFRILAMVLVQRAARNKRPLISLSVHFKTRNYNKTNPI